MKFFNLPPIHVPTLLGLFDPGQLWFGLDHGVDGLADGLLVNLPDVYLQAVHRLDHRLPLGQQFALAQGFIGVAFALHREPGHVAFAFGMALVVQVFHTFKGDGSAALQGQVLAAVQRGDLVKLIAVADQGQVASGTDLRADVGGLGNLVALGFLGAPVALFFHVVKGVGAVLRRKQAQGVAAVQVRFVAGGNLAGHQGGVAAGLQGDVIAGSQLAGELGSAVIGFADAFLAIFASGRDVVHIARRTDVDVLACDQAQVVARLGLAGQNIDIAPRIHSQVATGGHRRCQVFHLGSDDGLVPAVEQFVLFAAVGLGQQVDVVAGFERYVAACTHDAVVGDVAAGTDGQVFAGSDGAARVGDGAHACTVPHLDGGTVVEDVALDRRQAYLPAAYFTGHRVADAVLGDHLQVVTRVHQAALIEAAATAHVEVVAGTQGADVDQVAACDQCQVTPLNQAVATHAARIGLGQVKHGHQYFLAIDHAVFHPHDIVGQGTDLFGVQRDAKAQLERVLARQCVVHQVAVLVVVAGQAVGQEALAGLRQHGIADQPLFIQAVTQAAPIAVGADVEAVEDVVGTEKPRQVSQVRVGFDQVAAGWVGVANEQPVIALG